MKMKSQVAFMRSKVTDLLQVSRLPYIYQNLGHNYGHKVLASIGPDVLKRVVAQFNAEELLTKRPQVSALIRETLIKRAGEFNIILDDVSITGLSYSKEFLSAVERKQVAQQEAERSKFLVAKADHERRAAVIRAEGESESARAHIESCCRCWNGADSRISP